MGRPEDAKHRIAVVTNDEELRDKIIDLLQEEFPEDDFDIDWNWDVSSLSKTIKINKK
tara:strand:+ start:5167 stop:5340 length:174 start_codon:yes stop_codon:yes gene_type:complete